MELLFQTSLAIVFYTFFGYGMLLYVFVLLKRLWVPVKNAAIFYEPEISLVIPSYNEADILEQKIKNCYALNYPAGKCFLYFITDGSNDRSLEILSRHPHITVLHEEKRLGKTAAENRAMQYIKTPIVIFSDANSFLNPDAIQKMVKHFTDEKVGCVSGEKRIVLHETDNASAAGENLYWKYESVLKKLSSDFNSAVGAVGELVAFRSALYQSLPDDTLLDDFMQSMQMAAQGYIIRYEPEAFATETASVTVEEEFKRKKRIAVGSWQALFRLTAVVKITKTPLLFFQYFSHRILRWLFVPFLLVVIFFLNIPLMNNGAGYTWLLWLQVAFYTTALAGHTMRNKQIRFKVFFVPYYFCVMHFAVLSGLFKYLTGSQNGVWEKVSRESI
ncbi:MAG: glycosyltransferase family 2 protein [Bacteroidota bacterium]